MNTRQAQAEVTRRHLLDAARQVFAERGYMGATVALITDAANTAHGTFYLHFKNKEDVFVQVMADVLEEVYGPAFVLPEGVSEVRPSDHLRERIAAFLETCAAHRGLWRALHEGAIASPVVGAAWMSWRERFHGAVAKLFVRADATGDIEVVDPRIAADALCSMIEWYAFTGVSFGDDDSLAVTETVIDTLVTIWIKALAPAS